MLIQARNVNRRNELDDGRREENGGRETRRSAARCGAVPRKKKKKKRTSEVEKTRELVCGTAAAIDDVEEVQRYPVVVQWPTANFGISSNNREDRKNSGYPRDKLCAPSRAEPRGRP